VREGNYSLIKRPSTTDGSAAGPIAGVRLPRSHCPRRRPKSGGIHDDDTVLAIREHTSDTNGIIYTPRLKDLPDQVPTRIDREADRGALHDLELTKKNGGGFGLVDACLALIQAGIRDPVDRQRPVLHQAEHQLAPSAEGAGDSFPQFDRPSVSSMALAKPSKSCDR